MAIKDFIPITDVKQSVEKEVKEKPTLAELTTIESPGRLVSADNLEETEKKKIARRKIKREKAVPDKIEEPDKNSILIITEKPQAALKIASSLGKERKESENGVPYYVLERNGKKIIVGSAVGHLFNLTYKAGSKGWPIFDIEWRPSYEIKSASFTKRYYDLLKKLSIKSK